MTDNKVPKLLVSEAEAAEKIRSRIDIGKELLDTQINSQPEFEKLKSDTRKWTDYNKTLFNRLFDESPLLSMHGLIMSAVVGQSLNQEITSHRRNISRWINQLESIYDQRGLYEELPRDAQQSTNQDPVNTENKKIFIGHGRSLVWLLLKDFIKDDLKLPYEEFDSISPAGKTIKERLEEMLAVCCMAFIIMTGEDEQTDGKLRARENVVYEAGLFQGKLGFDEAIILLEDGCERFSNIEGLIYIPFPKGNIEAAFERVRKVLRQKSII